MKTKELIKMLQEADPTGEEEVSVGNIGVWHVTREPAYWDGCQQVLKLDPDAEYYNVIGAEIRGKGDKIVINDLSIRSAFWNRTDMPVTYDGEYAERNYKEHVEEWRKEAIDFKASRKKINKQQ
jgi:hypothetical protein